MPIHCQNCLIAGLKNVFPKTDKCFPYSDTWFPYHEISLEKTAVVIELYRFIHTSL